MIMPLISKLRLAVVLLFLAMILNFSVASARAGINDFIGFQSDFGESFFLPAEGNKKAVSFTLSDQFGNNTGVKFPSDKVCVLVFGDRERSEQIEGWVRPLYNKFTDQIYIFGIAELSAVPWVARPVVRRIIKSKTNNPIMLDWNGKISKAYGYQKGKANLFVIDKAGNIIAEKRGAASSAVLSTLYGEVRSAL